MTKFTDGPAYQVDTSDDVDTGLPAGCALIAGLLSWAALVVLWLIFTRMM